MFTSRYRRPLAILGALIFVSSVTLAASPLSASASGSLVPGGATAPLSAGAQAADVSLHSGNAWLTVGEPDPPDMPDALGEVAASAAGLADFEDRAFADSYYDPETGQVVISPATPVGKELADGFVKLHGADLVRVEPVDYSHEQLKQFGRQFIAEDEFLQEAAQELSISRGSRGVQIVLSEMPADPQRLMNAAAKYPCEVHFVVTTDVPVEGSQPFDENRIFEETPFSGGMGFIAGQSGANGNVCTGAFGYRIGTTDYMTTAGHCYYNDSTLNSMSLVDDTEYSDWDSPFPGEWVGNWNGQSSVNSTNGSITIGGEYHGDIAIVNLSQRGTAAGDRMWKGGTYATDKIDVYNRIAPYQDLYVCKNGAQTGSSCGNLKVTAVNVEMKLTDSGYWVRNIDRARGTSWSECSNAGDSGGSIYATRTSTTVTAVGIISGHYDFDGGDCQQRFTGLEEVVESWGGDVRKTG